VQGIPELTFVALALGLSMLVFRPEWQERIKLAPRSAMLSTIAILILSAIFSK
jgi:hypothetical protein